MNCWWTRRPENECRDKDHQCLLQSDTNLKTHPIIYLDFGSLGVHFISTWLFGLFPQRTYLQTYSLTDMWIEDRTSFSPKSSLSLVDLAITVSFLLEMIFIRSLYFFFPSEAFIPKSFPLAGSVRSYVSGERTVRGNRPSGLHCSALPQFSYRT